MLGYTGVNMNSEQKFKPGDIVFTRFGNSVIRGKFNHYSKLVKTFCYVDFETTGDYLYEFTQTLYEDELYLTESDALSGRTKWK